MELSWFECLIYGLISGFTEFLPVSALAHQAVFLNLIGEKDNYWLRLAAHLGSLVALIVIFMPTITRLRRENKIAKTPKSRRRRQPDFCAMMEIRLFKTAAISMILLFLGYSFVYNLYERLWLLALLLGINGILLYLPQYMPGANKSAESMSSLDGMLVGLAAGLGIVPGISRVGAGTSVALMRGADRRYAADLALLLCIPALAVMTVIDVVYGIGAAAVAVSAGMVFCCITVAVAAFAAAYLAVFLVRFLAVKADYSGFAYYCWGLALFSLIIYLI